MAKRKKLNIGQIRRIQQNRQRKLDKAESKTADVNISDDMLGADQQGLVISRFGQHAIIEDSDGETLQCDIRRTVTSLVCGDEVVWREISASSAKRTGVIEAVLPRRSALTRPDYYDGVKTVASNIDQIFVVSSILPEYSNQILDRYIIAAENMSITPVIVLNKVDLADESALAPIRQQLDYYHSLGYPIIELSCKTGVGIAQLHDQLNENTNIFVGQSGVGKSSLVNQLLPDADEIVGDVSDNSGLGQHTTTASKMLSLPSGGRLIDSPGVREFGLWHMNQEQVVNGFIEFLPLLSQCKFRDCKHKNDPGCAIRAAVESGEIAQFRFDNYHKIVLSMEENRSNRTFVR
ncbi:small ribosomal subunit biogenesis GTPase RsgA [Echinimonas agarilytica]|uniref:Small ribosomal subunit biogenesis GTPase RsgA n=1 Tax=Echinimonas agarilytica TaxID=1215918 RepID=A0AA41W422_9GAMM|nr:small ribosomal subunit biogenesis GTPase RsgA [Echinimonas agarilytica]MCM2678451.1 small ribosomal subunit biogenesis GTPase RsgA [Echinimonas agarilytica]